MISAEDATEIAERITVYGGAGAVILASWAKLFGRTIGRWIDDRVTAALNPIRDDLSCIRKDLAVVAGSLEQHIDHHPGRGE